MTWFKVDDGFGDHPKVDALRDGPCFGDAIALWTLAGSWSAKHLTNGLVPNGRVTRLGVKSPSRAAAELVRVGLWSKQDEGYLFHDWVSYQPSKEEVSGKREKTAARVRAWRERQTDEGNAPGNALQVDGCNAASNAAPVPSRPVPSIKGESEPPAALGPKSSTKTWSSLADVMRKAVEAGARAAQMPPPIECSEPDHRAWTECARQALQLGEAKGADPRDVMRLAAEEAVLDMPRRAWKVRHLAEDFVALVSADHIERRAKARGGIAA